MTASLLSSVAAIYLDSFFHINIYHYIYLDKL